MLYAHRGASFLMRWNLVGTSIDRNKLGLRLSTYFGATASQILPPHSSEKACMCRPSCMAYIRGTTSAWTCTPSWLLPVASPPVLALLLQQATRPNARVALAMRVRRQAPHLCRRCGGQPCTGCFQPWLPKHSSKKVYQYTGIVIHVLMMRLKRQSGMLLPHKRQDQLLRSYAIYTMMGLCKYRSPAHACCW